MIELAPLLKANADIPLKHFCSIPEAVVRLNVKDPNDPSLCKRQWPVSQVMHSYVVDQIKEWHASGVILQR
jgi:hypothetical protein